MMKYRQQFAGDVSVGGDEGNFTKELRELRENWRVRKMGTNIHGDLGYKTCWFIKLLRQKGSMKLL
jgi:hypothetical protein